LFIANKYISHIFDESNPKIEPLFPFLSNHYNDTLKIKQILIQTLETYNINQQPTFNSNSLTSSLAQHVNNLLSTIFKEVTQFYSLIIETLEKSLPLNKLLLNLKSFRKSIAETISSTISEYSNYIQIPDISKWSVKEMINHFFPIFSYYTHFLVQICLYLGGQNVPEQWRGNGA
jgi:hypothetical protein